MALNAFKVDGAELFASGFPCEPGVWSSPIPSLKDKLVYTQKWMQDQTAFVAADIGSVYPDIAGAPAARASMFLMSESELRPLGMGVIEWTRTYAKKPPQHIEWEWRPYNFIGYAYEITGAATDGRERFTKAVPAKVTFDYFRVGAGGDHATVDDIPMVLARKYYIGTVDHLTDYVSSPPMSPVTNPTRTEYAALVAGGLYSIVAEDTWPERWMGNIYVRRTVEVKAQ